MKKINLDDVIIVKNILHSLNAGNELTADIEGKNITIKLQHMLSKRQIQILGEGGLINWVKLHAVG